MRNTSTDTKAVHDHSQTRTFYNRNKKQEALGNPYETETHRVGSSCLVEEAGIKHGISSLFFCVHWQAQRHQLADVALRVITALSFAFLKGITKLHPTATEL